jgi:hypothetical protein
MILCPGKEFPTKEFPLMSEFSAERIKTKKSNTNENRLAQARLREGEWG